MHFAGLMLLIFSSFLPIAYPGLFVSLNIVFTALYDFILLPALLISTNRILYAQMKTT